MRTPSLPSVVLAALLLLVGLGGCSSGGNGTSPEDEFDVLEFDMLSDVLRTELASVGLYLMLPTGQPACLNVSSVEDTDGDGIPDDSNYEYSYEGCRFFSGAGVGTRSGTIHVQDAGATLGFTATLDDFTYEYNQSSPPLTFIQQMNGDRVVTASPTEATLTQNVEILYRVTGRPDATAQESWEVVYTPASGSEIAFGPGARVPEGSAAITGPFVWTQSGNIVTFSVQTSQPVRFDPECASPYPTGGEVHLQVLSGGPDGYVRLRWSGCANQPKVSFVSG